MCVSNGLTRLYPYIRYGSHFQPRPMINIGPMVEFVVPMLVPTCGLCLHLLFYVTLILFTWAQIFFVMIPEPTCAGN